MARPRSDEKQLAILNAAINEFAEFGVSAPTARIAKAAGVAEGTLFKYFCTKDELLNQLYLHLKDELRESMMCDFPHSGDVQHRTRFVWVKYLDWGMSHPQKRNVMAKLKMSCQLSESSKREGTQSFAAIGDMFEEGIANGLLRKQPTEFVAGLFAAISEMTMDLIEKNPNESRKYNKLGFEALWNAIVKT